MKILVLGGTGMAGHTISLYFKEQGYDVTVFSIAPFSYVKSVVGDALDLNLMKNIVNDDYDAVINCIGLLNQFAEENVSQSIFLNSYLPHFIVGELKHKKTKLIHMSTDCVFAGNTGPYYENSFCDGRTIYDRTKALGEVNDSKNLTFRNSIVGPDMNPNGIGLFNWFMQQTGTISGYTKAIWTGVTTLTLVKAMEQAIKENLCGLYNLVNNDSISKFDLLCLFNKHFRNNKLIINRSDTVVLDKSLKNTRCDFSFKVPSYEEMIREMKEWVNNHQTFYSHYFLK